MVGHTGTLLLRSRSVSADIGTLLRLSWPHTRPIGCRKQVCLNDSCKFYNDALVETRYHFAFICVRNLVPDIGSYPDRYRASALRTCEI